MNSPLLLDTHVAVWLALGEFIAPQGREALARAREDDRSMYLSAISAWEVAMLVAKGRLRLGREPLTWLAELEERFDIVVIDVTPQVLVASIGLPGDLHDDPSDRMLAATARLHGWRLVTRDRKLLAYAELGFIDAVAC